MKIFPLFIIITISLFSCSKQEILSKSSIEDFASKGKPITNLLPGTCPYDCHDTKCKAYLNGYCGTTTPISDTLKVVSNPNNPQETAGKKHNDGMYLIIPNYDYGTLQPTEQNMTTYRISFMTSQGYTTTFINKIDSTATAYFGDMYSDTSMTQTINTSYQQSLISLTAKNYLIQLSTSVYNFFKDSFGIPTQSEYNTFANNLITTKNQIKNNSTLSDKDKNCVLACYAVARYSSLYHINYSIQHTSSGGGTARFMSWFNIKDMVGDDVAGAIGGGLAGAGVAIWSGLTHTCYSSRCN